MDIQLAFELFGHQLFGHNGVVTMLMGQQKIMITIGSYTDSKNRETIFTGFPHEVPSEIVRKFVLDDNGAKAVIVTNDLGFQETYIEFFGTLKK